ncbi:hypothetical protein AB0I49_29110 [Streptomyces sp. NPDC050617]|uniref:hypothetical protein n=1 Tax=Streptomyces sp. NPDC050617 TaxID=3154628 RepID=UPI003422E135
MLSLRLARGAHPLVLLRRLLLTAAAGGVGFLLLCTLGHAVAHPKDIDGSLVRLAWCAVPLAATAQLSVAIARTDPATGPRSGLAAAGYGPGRVTLLSAVSAAVSCTLGSALALLVFLQLRGDLVGRPLGATAELLGAGEPLPWAAVLTLLAVGPVATAVASAVALRPRAPRAAADAPSGISHGLPWGIALTAVGLALEAYAGRGPAPSPESLFPLPGRLDGSPPGVVGGWVLTAIGLVLAGPGLAQLIGKVLSAGRPGALRLLAGRVLQDDAVRIGRPLGVVCAVASGALAAAELYGTAWESAGPRPFGPLTGLGAAVVIACATATAITAGLETRHRRGETTAALLRLGAPAAVLRGAAALRTAVLLAVLAALTWAVGLLAALPLTR